MKYIIRVAEVKQDYLISFDLNKIIHTEEFPDEGMLRIWYAERNYIGVKNEMSDMRKQ